MGELTRVLRVIYPLHHWPGLSVLNVFRYITFRSAYAAITALAISYWFGPVMIAWLRRVKLGQKVRQEGPQTHLGKAGTPTMGGLLIVTSIVVPCLLWATSIRASCGSRCSRPCGSAGSGFTSTTGCAS